MSSLKPEDSDKYLLTNEENERIFQKRVKPLLFKNAVGIQNPSAIILGGQPGAGKTISLVLAEEELKGRGGSIAILGDDLRALHPDYQRLMNLDDKTAAFFTSKDSGKWVEKCIDYAKQLRCNVIVEGTMRSPEVVSRTLQTFRESGYFVEVCALAVSERSSWQSVLQRYENQKWDSGVGRMALSDAHREACDGLLVSLDKIEREQLADSVCIYTRDAQLLYQNKIENGQWKNEPQARQVVEQERGRTWTLSERFSYAKNFDRLAELLQRPERHATSEEIAAVDAFRKTAYEDISVAEKKALVVHETAKAVFSGVIKNSQVTDSVVSTIEQALAKHIQENTVPEVTIYDKSRVSREPVLAQAISDRTPELEKGRER